MLNLLTEKVPSYQEANIENKLIEILCNWYRITHLTWKVVIKMSYMTDYSMSHKYEH